MDVEQDPRELPLGVALLLGAYLVAQQVTNFEPAGDTQRRMENALAYSAQDLRIAAPEFFVTGQVPELSALAHGWDPDDCLRFLVELRIANPFFPYQFEITKKRSVARRAALREIARGALRLEPGSADKVGEAWEEVNSAEKTFLRRATLAKKARDPKEWLKVVGVGAAMAGVAIAAAPAIAVLMPAAAGLSGAAAVSAGLAQLGFGSIAAGGLGMVGGMWVLGASGAAVGALSVTTATLLAQPGSAAVVGVEVRKLLVTFVLACDAVISVPSDDFAKGLDEMRDEVEAVIAKEELRNEAGSQRLTELLELRRTLEFAGEFMRDRSGPKSAD